MATTTAFSPQTNTVALAATTSSQQVALPATITNGTESIRVSNGTNQDVFIAFGTSSSVTAVIPVPGTPAAALHVPAKDVEVFLPPWGTTNIALIQAAAATGNIYFVEGSGL